MILYELRPNCPGGGYMPRRAKMPFLGRTLGRGPTIKQYSGRTETAKSHLGRVPYCRHMDIASPSPGVDRTIKIERHPACLFESSAASASVWWWMECNQGHLLSQSCLSTSRESSSQAHGRLFELKSKLTRVINCRVHSKYWH